MTPTFVLAETYYHSRDNKMNQSEFILSKIENMCARLVNDHSASPTQVDILRSQLDMKNISKYLTHLRTPQGIDRISNITRSMIGSDTNSLAVISEYLHCFKDIMAQ